MKAILFTNDKRVLLKNVNGSKLWFYYRGKLYDVDPVAVVLDEDTDKNEPPKPKLIYFENSSEPIKYSNAPVNDPSGGYLEKYIKLNAVRTQNKPNLMSRLRPALESFAGLFSIQNFIIIIVVGSMLYSALQGAGII